MVVQAKGTANRVIIGGREGLKFPKLCDVFCGWSHTRKVALWKQIEEIISGPDALTHLHRYVMIGTLLPSTRSTMLEFGIGIAKGIRHRLVKQELFDSKENRRPKKQVIAEAVVDELVGVFVGHDEGELVELEPEAEVVVKATVFQSLAQDGGTIVHV